MIEIVKELIKSSECPRCKGHLKIVKRKNYPFGKKSKSQKSKWLVCLKCDYQRFVRTIKEYKKRRTERRRK